MVSGSGAAGTAGVASAGFVVCGFVGGRRTAGGRGLGRLLATCGACGSLAIGKSTTGSCSGISCAVEGVIIFVGTCARGKRLAVAQFASTRERQRMIAFRKIGRCDGLGPIMRYPYKSIRTSSAPACPNTAHITKTAHIIKKSLQIRTKVLAPHFLSSCSYAEVRREPASKSRCNCPVGHLSSEGILPTL